MEHFFLLMSRSLKKPFVDEDRNSYAFESYDMAVEKAKSLAYRIFIKEERLDDALSSCLQAGANFFVIQRRASEEKITLLESTPYVKRGYYNSALNFYLMRYYRTKDKKYFRPLEKMRFLVAALVVDQKYIRYAATEGVNGKIYYIAFSDLIYFSFWSEKNPDYNPLEVSFKTLKRIVSGNHLVINPLGYMAPIIVSKEDLEKII